MREVVVTGAGTGIGYAVAESFVQAGDHVTITGRRPDVLAAAAERLGCGHAVFDAADPEQVEAAVERLPERVDVLVNNAGGLPEIPEVPAGGLAAVAADWTVTLAANLLTAVLVTEVLRPRLADGGRIVSIGSIAARRGAGSYGAAKAALEAWTASVARVLGPRGITANVVSPGLVLETEFFGPTMTDARRDRAVAETMTGRAGAPADVAAAVRLLSAPEAGHITGQVIHVNGGAYLGR